MYEDIAKMMSVSPYGGEKIAYPNQSLSDDKILPTSAARTHFGIGNEPIILNGDPNLSWDRQNEIGELRIQYLNSGTPAGHAFVLTVVYRHEFSSSLVKTLFAGGSNTNHEDVYMLWSRGSGIVDKRD